LRIDRAATCGIEGLMPPDILTKLAKQLYGLRDTGQIIPFAQVGIGDPSEADSWRPSPKFCHANVETWVMRSPEYVIVRGWVIFNMSGAPFLVPPFYRFAAHSVIRTPAGKLLDITPTDVSQPYPFIQHPGSTAEFDQLRLQYQIVYVDHYLG